MGMVRVTQGLMVQRTLNNINQHLRSLFTLQDRLATGHKVNAPSDDPIAARRAVNARTAIQKNEQYLTNVQAAGPQQTETVTALQTVVSLLQRALELTTQGANGAYDQTQRDQIASEINEVLEETLVQANHQTNGHYIFGGTRTLNPPFVAARNAENEITAVTYEGNDAHIELAVSDGSRVTLNETGHDAFLSAQDVFAMLIGIRDDLRAGDQNALSGQRLGEVNDALDQTLVSMARIGAIQNRLDRTRDNIDLYNVQLEELLSDTIDADYAETIMALNAQSNAFQAALNAGARVIQPSLLDYVR